MLRFRKFTTYLRQPFTQLPAESPCVTHTRAAGGLSVVAESDATEEDWPAVSKACTLIECVWLYPLPTLSDPLSAAACQPPPSTLILIETSRPFLAGADQLSVTLWPLLTALAPGVPTGP